MFGRVLPSLVVLLGVSTLGGCALPNTIEMLDDRAPPPEFGRPGWVRAFAGFGGWVGGLIGVPAAIVALPVTYPLSLLAEDGLGEHSSGEFMLWPAIGLAAAGHAAFGGPADVVDYVFRRAWVDGDDPVYSYDYVPMPAPELPDVPPEPVRGPDATPDVPRGDG